MTLKTEYSFRLPKGLVTEGGDILREGTMRLATAADEIEPLRDPRVRENEAYLTIIVLSRVITKLGKIQQINPKVIEGLFAADLAYLQDMYAIINFGNPDDLESLESETPLAANPDQGGA
jgi:hypothetical protein